MESAPEGFDFDRMVREVEGMKGVQDLHHVHLWRLDEERVALEAHVCIARRDLEEMERIKAAVKGKLHEGFGVAHATLEVEFDEHRDHECATIPNE